MSRYETLNQFKDDDPSQKSAILRAEMLTPIATIRGYATIMKQRLKAEPPTALPDDLEIWIDRILMAGNDLHELLETLTGSKE